MGEEMVSRRGNAWHVEEFGYSSGPTDQEESRDRIRASLERQHSGTPVFQVSIQALHLVFMAQNRNKRLMLTPVADDPEFGLVAGRTETARTILPRLEPATKFNDNAPG